MRKEIEILLVLALLPVLGFCKRQPLSKKENQVLGEYHNLGLISYQEHLF